VTQVFGNPTVFGPVADTPRWSGSAYAVVTIPLANEMGDLRLRGDVYGQTSFYFSNTAASITPQTKLPGYTIANFRIDWDKIAGSGLGFGLWVRNAFNEKYYVGGLAQGASLGVNSTNVGRPRMYGMELTAKF
jgi:iron complex outermembrane receptor protein